FFCFAACLWAFLTGMDKLSWGWLGFAGLLFGAAVLVRPAFAPFAVLPLVYHFFVERRRNIIGLTLAFGAGFVLVMAPWWIRNLVSLDQLIVLATGSGNPMLAGSDPYFREGSALFQNLQGVDQQALAIQRIKDGFRNEFWLFLEWFTVGKWWYLFREPWDIPHAGFLDSLRWLHKPLVYIGWAAAVLFAWRWRELRLFALMLVDMTGLQLMFLPHERYGFSMMPLVIMLTAMLVVRLWNLIRKEGQTL
ncbi:MAG TPA: hypothetical protein VFV52_09030, partial [Bacilli bacterium]|nr:hypothetical protein [Bacilli bacterium]